MDKYTILHAIETGGPGGAENVMIDIAVGLDPRRFHSIACLRKSGWLCNKLRKLGIETKILTETLLFDITFVARLLALVLRKNVALIHAHEFLMGVYCTLVGALSGKPVVTTLHGKYYYWEKSRRKLAMRLVSRYSQMVAVSNDLRYFLNKKTGIRPDSVETIYNGVNPQVYLDKADISSKRIQLGLDDRTRIVGTVGNLYPVKGQMYLLQAIPMIIRQFPRVVFLFVGRGDQEKNLRTEALNLGISNYVRFLGFRSDVAELLGIMDVFVLPSLSECLPLSVLEAMAMSVPPVVTDVGGNREIIENNKTGYLVPPCYPDALAEKILILLKDKKKATTMGSQACKTIEAKFSLESMLFSYQALYDSLLSTDA